jgi:hypothetical protein
MSTYKDYFNKIWYDPKNPVGFTGLKVSRRLSFHISTCLSSIFSISFHNSWIVRRYEKYGRNPSWIVKRFGKYRRKLWNDMENMEEEEVE